MSDINQNTFYLVIHSDLRVCISFVQRLHFAEMMFLRKLYHSEENRDLYWQLLELQFAFVEKKKLSDSVFF